MFVAGTGSLAPTSSRGKPPTPPMGAATCHPVGASAREGHCARPMAVELPVRCAPRLGSRWGSGNTVRQRMEMQQPCCVACAASAATASHEAVQQWGERRPYWMRPGGRVRRSPEHAVAERPTHDKRGGCWPGRNGGGGGLDGGAQLLRSCGLHPERHAFQLQASIRARLSGPSWPDQVGPRRNPALGRRTTDEVALAGICSGHTPSLRGPNRRLNSKAFLPWPNETWTNHHRPMMGLPPWFTRLADRGCRLPKSLPEKSRPQPSR